MAAPMHRYLISLSCIAFLGAAACQSTQKPEATPDSSDRLSAAALPYASSDAGRLALDQFRDVLGDGVVDNLLSEVDQRHFRNAAGEALEQKPEGGRSSWYNPLSGHGGSFAVNSAFRGPDGRPCKRLTQKVLVDDRAHVVHSMACKAGDDRWSNFSG